MLGLRPYSIPHAAHHLTDPELGRPGLSRRVSCPTISLVSQLARGLVEALWSVGISRLRPSGTVSRVLWPGELERLTHLMSARRVCSHNSSTRHLRQRDSQQGCYTRLVQQLANEAQRCEASPSRRAPFLPMSLSTLCCTPRQHRPRRNGQLPRVVAPTGMALAAQLRAHCTGHERL